MYVDGEVKARKEKGAWIARVTVMLDSGWCIYLEVPTMGRATALCAMDEVLNEMGVRHVHK